MSFVVVTDTSTGTSWSLLMVYINTPDEVPSQTVLVEGPVTLMAARTLTFVLREDGKEHPSCGVAVTIMVKTRAGHKALLVGAHVALTVVVDAAADKSNRQTSAVRTRRGWGVQVCMCRPGRV